MTISRGRRLTYLEVYPEIHCDHCSDIVHNHIDCPACGEEYSGTDQFTDLQEDKGIEINCGNCNAVLELKSSNWYDEPIVVLKNACFINSQPLTTEWLQSAANNPVFDFLKSPEEDVYTLADGKTCNE